MIYGNNSALKKTTRRKRRRSFPRERFKRAQVSIQNKNQNTPLLLDGRVFLNDLGPNSIGIFSTGSINKGENISIVIDLDHSQKLFVKGVVLWCNLYQLQSKILSEKVYPYRIGVRLHFEDQQDKQAVQNYCEQLALKWAA